MEQHTHKILLVEDDPNFGRILRDYLEMNDYDVVHAKNGLEGFQKFKKEYFDLCILDVMMPYKDGFTLAKEIREINKEVPIVFLTAAYKSEEFKEKGFSLGATDYLTKPIDDYQLTSRINAYLSIIKLEKNHKSELERRVEERTSELKKALSQIKETNFKIEV